MAKLTSLFLKVLQVNLTDFDCCKMIVQTFIMPQIYKFSSLIQTVLLKFIAHLSQRLISELMAGIRTVVCHPSVVRCQHFQTSSPQKPLGQLKPNFVWSLHGLGEQNSLQLVMVT